MTTSSEAPTGDFSLKNKKLDEQFFDGTARGCRKPAAGSPRYSSSGRCIIQRQPLLQIDSWISSKA
jgi:hypothetical protein